MTPVTQIRRILDELEATSPAMDDQGALGSGYASALRDVREQITLRFGPEPPPRACPFCGGTERIFSLYRDGGSTLYHQPCGRARHWPNPDFNRPAPGVR